MIEYSYYHKNHPGSITAVMDCASGTMPQDKIIISSRTGQPVQKRELSLKIYNSMPFKKLLFFTILILCLTNILYPQNCDSIKYRRIESIYYDLDSNFISVDKDSIIFDGYLVFKINKFKQNLFTYESNLGPKTVEIYWLKNLNNFNTEHKDYYMMSDYFLYFMYATQDISSDMPPDTSETGLKDIEFYNSKEFLKFKNLFFKYYDYNNKKSYNDIFLKYGLCTNILKSNSIDLLSYDNCDSIGYFIYKCKFSSAVLKYKSFCVNYITGTSDNEKIIIPLGYIYTLLPISSAYIFNPVLEIEVSKKGFKKSKWYPDELFN